MTLTHEELAAYADGELEGAEAARVLLTVAANPELMRTVQRYRALRERIGAEFAPNLEQELPDRLAALLRPPEENARRDRRRQPEMHVRRVPQQQRTQRPVPQHEVASDAPPSLSQRRWLIVPVLVAAMAVAAFFPA